MTQRCILTVHAHPDDEASKGSATIAKYADAGVKTVLVCCTGGEEGDILNPAVDTPETRKNLAEVRRQELADSARIIGYEKVYELGYRDSGMPKTDSPEAFANVPLNEAVEKLVCVIRVEKPQVIITYSDDQQGYPHPDHIRVHDISIRAFSLSADEEVFPAAGAPHQVQKLYYTTWSRERIKSLHKRFKKLGMKSPYNRKWLKRPSADKRITTKVNVADWYDRRCDSLLSHKTQVVPDSSFWFGLPREEARDAYPWDDYILEKSLVDSKIPETDLFTGVEAR